MNSEAQGGHEKSSAQVIVGDGTMTLEDLMAVAFEGRTVQLSEDPLWRAKLQEGRAIIERSLSSGHKIYGVSTGVGYSSGHTIDPDHTHEFAYQIIRQHGCGLGEMLTMEEGRAVVFARLVSLAKGYSAVRLELLEALCGLFACPPHSRSERIFYRNASIPGNFFPARKSIIAPPPVEMKLNFLSSLYFLRNITVSPPPATENAHRFRAIARTSAMLPRAYFFFSMRPSGPLQRMVRASLILRPNTCIAFGPRSHIILPCQIKSSGKIRFL